ncbi:MAG: site-specific integrase [Oscillospiraceae bacterium]|jgi:integrase|nr:site-specific integrase [Oscillospiraceae bacterium]MCI2190685.1 site-specific integrase [Oscillospiraceae bacterium]MCI2206673.1 site-specific integrase [Oscillospiraceae bacterium]
MATVQKRGNSYRIRASAGYDVYGKQIMRSKTWTPKEGMTKNQIGKELERQKVLFDEDIKAGLYTDSNIKFQDFAEKWFEEYAENRLRKKTIEGYRRAMDRIYPAIGHIHLNRLQPQHIMKFYHQLETTNQCGKIRYFPKPDVIKAARAHTDVQTIAQRAGLAPSTIKTAESGHSVNKNSAEKIAQALNQPIKTLFTIEYSGDHLSAKTIREYHCVISTILERAVKWQIIKDNPCRRVDPPRVPEHDIQCLDDKQSVILLEQLKHESIEDQTLFTLALYTGMRRGELLGLEWQDINFDAEVLSVRRTSQYAVGKGMYEDTTKTVRSKRSIRVTSGIMSLLRAYRASQNSHRLAMGDRWNNEWENHPWLFTNSDGTPMSSSTPLNHLKRILKRANLPSVSLHSLRHTSATLLIGQGIDVRTVSGRLGHSQTSTTMNIYAHQLQSADAAASAALEVVLSGNKKRA